MLFNSYQFIFAFLPLTVIIYILIGNSLGRGPAIGWVVFASLFFYAYWNPIYLVLIVFSMLFNFGIGRLLTFLRTSQQSMSNKLILVSGLSVNLGLLGYFKYANFFVDNINNIFGFDFHLQNIILPLAISFFTFQQITYLVDTWKGCTAEYKFIHYALFVSFFPQLIAGPLYTTAKFCPNSKKQTEI